MADRAPIAVVGNANLDLVGGPLDRWPEQGTETFLDRADSRIGGSAANTALVLRRLGARAGLIASAGADIVGDMIAGQFGGPLDRITRTLGPSSVSFGVLHPGSERSFFSTPGHLDHFTADTVGHGLDGWPVAGAIMLLSGSFALPQLGPETTAILRHWRAQGAQTVIDPGWPGDGWTKANQALAFDWIAQSDAILLNDKELLGLTGGAAIELALERASLHLRDDAALVVKCGPKGAMCRIGSETFRASSPAADVFDTIGAGDAFNAGYLAAWQAGHPPKARLQAGCVIASNVIRDFPRGTTALDLSFL